MILDNPLAARTLFQNLITALGNTADFRQGRSVSTGTPDGFARVAGRLWEDFSFVVSSGYREKVISCLVVKPKVPKQLATDTKLRIAHVSRALRELSRQGLVECLTPSVKSRGRLYALTEPGYHLTSYMTSSTRRFVPALSPAEPPAFVLKSRARAVRRCIGFLKAAKGEVAVRQALRDWSADPEALTEDTWLSVDVLDEFLELVEAKFGDGSYDFIRQLYSQTIIQVPSVKEQVSKLIPLELLAERAPIVYQQEWNFGRLEVKVSPGRALFQHYDWMPTPGMCSMLQGAYEGVLKARRTAGTVTKTRCVREGDDHCAYLAEWQARGGRGGRG